MVEEVESSENLEKKEQYWIDKYLSILYNGCKQAGNKFGFKHSEETRKKIGEANKGKMVSEETREKISKNLKGKSKSFETKEKISKAIKGKKRIFSEKSIKEATERLRPFMLGQKKGFKHTDKTKSLMSQVRMGVKQSEETKKKRAEKLHKAIYQYDKKMNFIKEWKSIKEAGEFLGIRRAFISSVLTGLKKSAKGFIFKYKENEN